MPKRILLDVDGVLADFVGATLDALVALGGPRLSHDHVDSWDLFAAIPLEFGEPLRAAWRRPGFCANIPLLPGAVETVAKLRESGRVVFVTAPMSEAPHWMWERDQWLRLHLGANSDEIVFATAKDHVVGDLLVDDRASNVIAWHARHPSSRAILWDTPFNRHDTVPETISRFKSWDRLLDLARMSPSGFWGAGPDGRSRKPCPEDPVVLLGKPIGMYHCPCCSAMQFAGMPHLAPDPDYERVYGQSWPLGYEP